MKKQFLLLLLTLSLSSIFVPVSAMEKSREWLDASIKLAQLRDEFEELLEARNEVLSRNISTPELAKQDYDDNILPSAQALDQKVTEFMRDLLVLRKANPASKSEFTGITDDSIQLSKKIGFNFRLER